MAAKRRGTSRSARIHSSPPFRPIENYAVIGDLSTVALVGLDGSIDFMCYPNFDSPSIFCALLDHRKGGSFKLAPTLNQARHRQLYMPDSNILLTRFLSNDGIAEVSDFMPIDSRDPSRKLVRRAKTIRGEINFQMICDPRFDYARASHKTHAKKHEAVFVSQGEDRTALRLRCEAPIRIVNGAAMAEFKLRAGQTAAFVLEEAGTSKDSPAAAPHFVAESFKETMNFWQRWVQRSTYRGRWREMVNRSALTLKLLTSAKFGSIVAAPTFGLPEDIGGVRNWDYRYTWIRDASFTVYALMRLGYGEEASAFMKWIENRCRELKPGNPLQLMYRLDGRHDLTEVELTHLEGYRRSRPVRIGNGASNQLQLDIYGELMDSVYIHNKFGELISYDFWMHLSQLIDWVCANWQRPDHGIWEVRGGPFEFLYSKVMTWVAIDRGMRLAQKRSFPAPLEKWGRIRDEIYQEIYRNYWSPEVKSFVQYRGAKTVDASALLMPMVKFIGPSDPRWCSTLTVINQRLLNDSLVYRYNVLEGANSGFKGGEGTFTICSFWNVECLARGGDLKKARFFFEKTLGYANHVGLFSEELGPSGEHLGNFPQAFTHLGLISAAYYLDHHLDEASGKSA
jgi:GH15 family glucan-1,4-alpha-glucosidase